MSRDVWGRNKRNTNEPQLIKIYPQQCGIKQMSSLRVATEELISARWKPCSIVSDMPHG